MTLRILPYHNIMSSYFPSTGTSPGSADPLKIGDQSQTRSKVSGELGFVLSDCLYPTNQVVSPSEGVSGWKAQFLRNFEKARQTPSPSGASACSTGSTGTLQQKAACYPAASSTQSSPLNQTDRLSIHDTSNEASTSTSDSLLASRPLLHRQ
jgi:hypothetical protein